MAEEIKDATEEVAVVAGSESSDKKSYEFFTSEQSKDSAGADKSESESTATNGDTDKSEGSEKDKKPEEDKVEAKIKVGEKEYTTEQLNKAITDSENITAMRKSSTDKYNAASELGKTAQNAIDFISSVGDKETAKNLLLDTHGDDKEKQIDDFLNLKLDHNPFEIEIKQLKSDKTQLEETIAELEEKNIIRETKESLINDGKTEVQANEIIEFARKKFDEGSRMTIEDATSIKENEELKVENEKIKKENEELKAVKENPDNIPVIDKDGATDTIKDVEVTPKNLKDVHLAEEKSFFNK